MYRRQVQGRTGAVQDTICTLQCMPAQSAAAQPALMLDTDNMQGVKICSAAQRSISTYLHSAAYLHIYTISTATLINSLLPVGRYINMDRSLTELVIS